MAIVVICLYISGLIGMALTILYAHVLSKKNGYNVTKFDILFNTLALVMWPVVYPVLVFVLIYMIVSELIKYWKFESLHSNSGNNKEKNL